MEKEQIFATTKIKTCLDENMKRDEWVNKRMTLRSREANNAWKTLDIER